MPKVLEEAEDACALRRFGLALVRDERLVADEQAAARLVDKLIRQSGVVPVAEAVKGVAQAVGSQAVNSHGRQSEVTGQLHQQLSVLLSDLELEAFVARVTQLAADPTYPILDQWDGRPFEWQ